MPVKIVIGPNIRSPVRTDGLPSVSYYLGQCQVKMTGVHRFVIFLALLALAACGGGGMTPRQVYDQLERAGLASNPRTSLPIETDSPIGRCGERLEFDIPDAPVGAFGVILVCPKEPLLNVSAISGAVLYRSAGGSVAVMVSGAPAAAPRIGEEIERIRE